MDSVRRNGPAKFAPIPGVSLYDEAPETERSAIGAQSGVQDQRVPAKGKKKAVLHRSAGMPLPEKLVCRGLQTSLYMAMPLLPYKDPQILESIEKIVPALNRRNAKRVLIVADPALTKSAIFREICQILDNARIETALFDGVKPNPETGSVLLAAELYKKRKCQAMIAFGGGSSIDLAKACGAAITHPKKPLTSMAGILKVIKKTPYLIAIPTTAGTGSETTLAAVLVDEKTRHKFAINDFPLIPDAAVLDDRCVHELPSPLAAQTGMDALCHAVEAYIGRSVTKQTGKWALEAVRLIFENIDGYVHHSSRQAERRMLLASHLAGKAFTRSYVGYIHALSHALSGQYNVPHGKTNAILMPVVLREYGSAIYPALARLAIAAGLQEDPGQSEKELAEAFISAIEEMNRRYGIPAGIEEIEIKDLPLLARNAAAEANPLYPVPVLFGEKELAGIYLKVLS